MAQAEDAASEGGKEIVLTGVNIGDFGKTTRENFLQLLKALANVEGIERYQQSAGTRCHYSSRQAEGAV